MFVFHSLVHRMKFSLLFMILLLMGAVGCSDDDDPVRPSTGHDISGQVVTPDGDPASEAMVYLGVEPEYAPFTATVIIDSVMTDDSGGYAFDELGMGFYQVYAGIWDGGGEDFSLVSSFSKPVTVDGKSMGHVLNLALLEPLDDGIVAGEAVYEDEGAMAPADSADVRLYRYLGAGTYLDNEGKTNLEGKYALPGVVTGNYTVTVTKTFSPDAPFPLYMSAESEAFFCAGDDFVRVEQLILRDVMVEKPAVYIYPELEGIFRVELGLGPGIRLAASEPEYGDGWSVLVDENGRIDGSWDYLFYEVAMRGAPKIDEGWCFSWAELPAGLAGVTADLGLNPAEREDFLDYWRERLPRRDYYEIHPVFGADLDPWVELRIAPAPKTVLRFWLFFTGRDTEKELLAPEFSPPQRTGTTVVEWGGAVIP